MNEEEEEIPGVECEGNEGGVGVGQVRAPGCRVEGEHQTNMSPGEIFYPDYYHLRVVFCVI